MKVISPLFSSLRGSLGGAVGSVARGGIAYLRSKVIPTNPSSLLQTAIRSAVQSVSALWQNTLTELQQEGWYDIAEGAQTGKSLFAKVNQPRIYASNSTRVTDETGGGITVLPAYFPDAPSDGLNVDFALPFEPIIDDSANTLDIQGVVAGNWNLGADATHMSMVFVYVSGPQNSSRAARQRPYALARAYAIADAGDIIFTPINLATLGYPTIVGKVFYVKVYAQDNKGRTSLAQEFRTTVVA